jgi:3-deoxy-manno-octulosonate cytidylyltransferase (CMP-KDO synthetase)
MKKVAGIIPARYRSSRYPGKPLVELLGKPMILHVAEIAAKALGQANVYVATDDQRIEKLVKKAGFNVVMTSSHALTGTDRLWEAAQQIDADIFVNIQGDEPILDYRDIQKIVKTKQNNFDFVINGMCPLSSYESPENINIPKVVFNEKREMVYMSRLAVPGFKEIAKKPREYWKQVCIYAFSYDELKAFGSCAQKGGFEENEDIEILRFFELGIKVKMVETQGSSLAVDVPEDVALVEAELLRQQNENQRL